MNDATITALTAQCRDIQDWQIRLRKNNNMMDFAIYNISGNHNEDLNIDINANDIIQLYVTTNGFIHDPSVVLEIAWRNSSLL